eukprot:PhF_6_TR8288/c0_g1_i2/m.12728
MPLILSKLYDVCFAHLKSHDDDFVQMSRKATLAFCLVYCFLAIFQRLYAMITSIQGIKPWQETLIESPGWFTFTVANVYVWNKARVCKKIQGVDMTLQIFGACMAALGYQLIDGKNDYGTLWCTLTILTALLHLPVWQNRAMNIGFSLVFALTFYNNSFGDRTLNGTRYPRLIIQDVATMDSLSFQVSVYFVLLFVMWGQSYQSQQFRTLLRKVELSADTARGVAKDLSVYDTTGAKKLLQEYSQHPDADCALYESWKTIAENMEVYRQFLPNYLLGPREEDDSGGDDDERSKMRSDMHSTAVSTESGTPLAPNYVVPFDSSIEVINASTTSSSSTTPSGVRSSSPVRQDKAVLLIEPSTRHITVGLIEYSNLYADNRNGSMDDLTTLFVDTVLDAARSHSGAVHS